MGDPYPGVVPPIETPETTTLINRARIEPLVEVRPSQLEGASAFVSESTREMTSKGQWGRFSWFGLRRVAGRADSH